MYERVFYGLYWLAREEQMSKLIVCWSWLRSWAVIWVVLVTHQWVFQNVLPWAIWGNGWWHDWHCKFRTNDWFHPVLSNMQNWLMSIFQFLLHKLKLSLHFWSLFGEILRSVEMRSENIRGLGIFSVGFTWWDHVTKLPYNVARSVCFFFHLATNKQVCIYLWQCSKQRESPSEV